MQSIPPEWLDKYRGKVIIILGNGASINNYDLTDPFFTKNITFGSNAIAKKFIPTFYYFSDRLIIPLHWNTIKKTAGKSTFFIGKWLITNLPSEVKEAIRPIQPVYYRFGDAVGAPNGQIYHGRTSGCVMLHIALLMGFKYIFTLGIDGYGGRTDTHFYEPKTQFVNEFAARMNDHAAKQHIHATLKWASKNNRYIYALNPNNHQIPLYKGPQ